MRGIKMKKQLLIMSFALALVGVFQELNSMQGSDYTLACKKLGIRPDVTLTEKQLDTVYCEKRDNAPANEKFNMLIAKKAVQKVYQFRNDAKADKMYKKSIIERIQNGLFTQQLTISESRRDSSRSIKYVINVYDYKRIFGAFGIVGTAAVGLTYLFKNELSSLFTLTTAKIPFLAKKS
jgi:uncharacterized protein (DUF1015 family)